MAEKENEDEKTLSEVVAQGDQLASLRALANILAEALEDTGSKKEIAALALRLSNTLARIDELDPQVEETAADRIKRGAKGQK